MTIYDFQRFLIDEQKVRIIFLNICYKYNKATFFLFEVLNKKIWLINTYEYLNYFEVCRFCLLYFFFFFFLK